MRLKSRIDRLAFEREYSENAFVHAAKRFTPCEPFEPFDSQREFTKREGALIT